MHEDEAKALEHFRGEAERLSKLAKERGEEVEKLGRERDALLADQRERTHKEAFGRVAAAAGARPEALEDLYLLSGHRPMSDGVDDKALGALVEGLKATKTYMFAVEEKRALERRPAPPHSTRNGGGADVAHDRAREINEVAFGSLDVLRFSPKEVAEAMRAKRGG